MSDPWHPEGIWSCVGCGTIYAEYVNGCPRHDWKPRKVVLVVAESEVSDGGEDRP